MPQHIADFALDAILTLSASWATHVSACQQAQVRNLWNFKNLANLNAWSTEAQMYVAASNGFASFPVLWLLTRPIGWPGCWCMPVRNYGISKMSQIRMPDVPKLTIIWPLRMGLALSLFCDFWHDPSVDLAVGVCWWEVYGIPKMAQMWIPESLKHTICWPCRICFAFSLICHL